jgi:hypothetical protein
MSSEDLENLMCLVGPVVNKKNTDFKDSISVTERLPITQIPCNWGFIWQHEVPA